MSTVPGKNGSGPSPSLAHKTPLLHYYKTILKKVSFDQKLLTKEYQKAIRALKDPEAQDLDYWLKSSGLAGKLESIGSSQSKSRIRESIQNKIPLRNENSTNIAFI